MQRLRKRVIKKVSNAKHPGIMHPALKNKDDKKVGDAKHQNILFNQLHYS